MIHVIRQSNSIFLIFHSYPQFMILNIFLEEEEEQDLNEIIEQDFTKTLEQDTKKMVDLEASLLEGSSPETITETDEDKAADGTAEATSDAA